MIQGPQLPQLALYFVVVLKGARTDATPRLPLSAVLASSVRLGPKAGFFLTPAVEKTKAQGKNSS